MLNGERCILCNAYFKFEQLQAGPDGFGICRNCAVKTSAANDLRRRCPVDESAMDKALLRGVVLVDRCPSCNGVWFDGDKLQIVDRGIRADVRAEGFTNLL